MNMNLPDNVFPETALSGSRSIGEILIEAGRLTVEDAKRISQEQSQGGLRFGEAAVQLNLLTRADIEFALARQFDYPYLLPDSGTIASSVVTAYRPFGPVAEQIRSLRARLLVRHLERHSGQRTFTVVSAMRREGRSFIAANLAVVFSQMGERTLLIDADMRNPSQHELFHFKNVLGVSNVLAGRADLRDAVRVPGLVGLSVLSAGSVPPNPQELLTRARLSTLIGEAGEMYDVVVVDTPAASLSADAQIIAARTSGSLLVSRIGVTDGNMLRRVVTSLNESGANLIGAVANDA